MASQDYCGVALDDDGLRVRSLSIGAGLREWSGAWLGAASDWLYPTRRKRAIPTQ